MVPCAVIFAGQRLKSKQSELLVQLKKTMIQCKYQKLLDELQAFAEKLQGQPIIARYSLSEWGWYWTSSNDQ
jgi:hypothetical protein